MNVSVWNPSGLPKKLLSPIGRLEFAGALLMSTGMAAILAPNYWMHNSTEEPLRTIMLVLISPIILLCLLGIIYAAARRLADLARPARQAWLMLVPGYNLYLTAVLLTRQRAVPQGMRVSDRLPALRWFALGGGVFACLLALALYVMIYLLKLLLPAWGGPV